LIESNLNDDDIKLKLEELTEFERNLETSRNIYNSMIFKTKKLEFSESDFNLEKNNVI
jgi:hypothetical protein